MKLHQLHKTDVLLLLVLLGLLSSSVQANGIHLPMTQASSGNFYLHARLNDAVETDLLLDTGSGYVTLSKTTFKKISAGNKAIFKRNIYGKLANGQTMEVPIYELSQLSLAENCVLRDIEVAVFPNADRDILGLNALSHMQPFTMQMDPPLLSSASCH